MVLACESHVREALILLFPYRHVLLILILALLFAIYRLNAYADYLLSRPYSAPGYLGARRTQKEFELHVRQTTFRELQKLRQSSEWKKHVSLRAAGRYPPIQLKEEDAIRFSDEES